MPFLPILPQVDLAEKQFVSHIETADGSYLAVINSEVEVSDLVCAVETFRDAHPCMAELSVVQSALLLESEHVVESWCDDERAFRRDQDALSGTEHAFSILVDDERIVDGDELRLEKVLQLCQRKIKFPFSHRVLASGQVSGQLNRYRYASGAHWTDIVSERVGHEGVLPCQMLNLVLFLLGKHVGVLAP